MEKKSVEESYKEIIKLYNQGLRGQEIADKIGLSINTVRRYMVILRKEGRLPQSTRKKVQKRKYTKKEIEEQNERIIEQYNKNISVKKIAENIGVPEGTVFNRIKNLILLGRLNKRPNLQQKADQRRQRIIELYKQGVSVEEMSNNLAVSKNTISKYISELISTGEIVPKPKEISPEMKEKYRKILKWRKQGLNAEEMAKRLKCSKATVFNYIKALKEIGVIPYNERERVTVEELEQENIDIIKWYQQGLIAKEIAENLGLKLNTVNCRIYELRKAGRIPPAREENEERKKNRRTRRILSDFLEQQKQIFMKGKNPSDNDFGRIIKTVQILGYREEDVNFLVRIYSKKSMYLEAVKLLDDYIASKKLPESKKKSIIIVQNQLRKQERIKRGLHKKKIPNSMTREGKYNNGESIR